MKKTNSEIRRNARLALEGNWGKGVIATLIYAVFTGALPTIVGLADPQNYWSNLWYLVCIPMMWGYAVYFLRFFRQEDASYGHLFDGYRDFTRIFLTYLLQALYTLLWTLLLIIPGIIKGLSYALTPYVLRDNPELKYNGAIEESMRLMQGNKMKLFLLYLSFIGWALLCILTFGIGFLLLYPYMQASVSAFYLDLKEQEASATGEETLDIVVDEVAATPEA